MSCTLFRKFAVLVIAILTIIDLYLICFSTVDTKTRNRIDNFSNVNHAQVHDVHVTANGAIKKVLVSNLKEQEISFILSGASSKLFIQKAKNKIALFEEILEPKITLENTLQLQKYALSTTSLKAETAQFDYTSQLLTLQKGNIFTQLNHEGTQSPIKIDFESCSISQESQPLVQVTTCKLTSKDITITSDKLFFDNEKVHMTNKVHITYNHPKFGIQTLEAAELIFDAKTRIIHLHSDQNSLIVLNDPINETTIKATHLEIDCSKGLQQACIKSDSTVECSKNVAQQKPIKEYFFHE